MAECKKNRINYTTAKHSGTTCYTSSLFGTRILWLIASYEDVPPSLELRSTANVGTNAGSATACSLVLTKCCT